MTISYLAAFLGGMISLLSPCSALVVPMFAASSTLSSKRLLESTVLFTLGILLVLLPVSLGFVVLTSWVNLHRQLLNTIFGSSFVLIGLSILLHRHVTFPNFNRLLPSRYSRSTGLIMLGIVASIGSTTCIGPILGAILTLSITSANRFTPIGLMLAYALGIVLPLLLLARVYDRHGARFTKRLYQSHLTLGSYSIPYVQLVSVGLFFFLAYIFLFLDGNYNRFPGLGHLPFSRDVFNLQFKIFSW